MGVIGKHVKSSGLMEAMIEANVLGPKTAEQVLHGKSYARGMRVHKITLQSMWRLLLPSLLDFIEFRNPGLKDDLEHKKDGLVEDFVTFLASDVFRNTIRWRHTLSPMTTQTSGFGGATCKWSISYCCSLMLKGTEFGICTSTPSRGCCPISCVTIMSTMLDGEPSIWMRCINFHKKSRGSLSREILLSSALHSSSTRWILIRARNGSGALVRRESV